MNLVLDAGNTVIKAGIFEAGELTHQAELTYNDVEAYCRKSGAQHVIVSSVGKNVRIDGQSGQVVQLNHETPLPITLDYETPQTLGMDRVAAAVGASVLNPGHSLVIDAGTCVTCDIVENGSVFSGGSIAPGANLRATAMHSFTARLPEIDVWQSNPSVTGKSTTEAMSSGVLHGMTFELRGIIAYYQAKYPDIQIFLCGGEAKLFENRLKDGIFAVPELVLVGLNRILEHNL